MVSLYLIRIRLTSFRYERGVCCGSLCTEQETVRSRRQQACERSIGVVSIKFSVRFVWLEVASIRMPAVLCAGFP